MFKVGIIGGENISNYLAFEKKCIYFLKNKAKQGIFICYFGDKAVDNFSKRYNIDTLVIPLDWKKYNKESYQIRNNELLKNCEALIIFENEKNKYLSLEKMANEKNIPIRKIKARL